MKRKTIIRILLTVLTLLLMVTSMNAVNTDSVGEYLNPIIDELAENAGLAPLSADVYLRPVGTRCNAQTESYYNADYYTAVFSATDGSDSTVYYIDLSRTNVKKGILEIITAHNGGDPTLVVAGAGTGYRKLNGSVISPSQLAGAANVSMNVSFSGGHLYLDYTDVYEGVTNQKRYDIFLDGKSLCVHVTSPSERGKGGYAYFTTGSAENLSSPQIDSVIYAEDVSITKIDRSYFVSAYVDKAKSFATKVTNSPARYASSTVHGMLAEYELNSASKTNPLNEIFYVTVSDDALDCVYENNAEASEYYDYLAKYVVYDSWGTGKYIARANTVDYLAAHFGLKDMILVDHRWQRDTLDQSNPVFYPASTEYGDSKTFKAYLDKIRDVGWQICLHEDYWFFDETPTNQYWNASDRDSRIAKNPDGSYRAGWADGWAIKSNDMAHYAEIESELIADDYKPEASFLDVNGGVDPLFMHQLTYDANSSTARTMAQVVADNVNLFKTVRDIMGGPIISEGAQGERSFGSCYAGYLESGSREITGNSECRIMPDYELKHIRTKMVNEGMGPPQRFQTSFEQYGEDFDYDKYNATAIAYGHTGFIGDVHMSTFDEAQMVNAYYMFRALQEQYLDPDVSVEQITYYTESGKKLDLNAAMLAGYDFTASRLYICYSNGLEIYLNFSDEEWTVRLNGHTYVLDQNGFAAENPNLHFIEYSCLVEGERADFCSCDQYIYANPRDSYLDFGSGLMVDGIYINKADGFYFYESEDVPDPIKFATLPTSVNGANGLTYYRMNAGKLTKFSSRSVVNGIDKWTYGSSGTLIYPSQNAAENYGVAGTASTDSVVLEYVLPYSGRIDLFSWIALQGNAAAQHGYTVKIALNDVSDVLFSYTHQGDAQDVYSHTYPLKVEEGQKLYVIYEPYVKKNNEWFGYKVSVTYKTLQLSQEPTITHEPVTMAQANSDLVLTASLPEDMSDGSISVYFRAAGATRYTCANGVRQNDDSFKLTIPASSVKGTELEYYLESSFAGQHGHFASADDPQTVTVVGVSGDDSWILNQQYMLTGIVPLSGAISLPTFDTGVRGENNLSYYAVSGGKLHEMTYHEDGFWWYAPEGATVAATVKPKAWSAYSSRVEITNAAYPVICFEAPKTGTMVLYVDCGYGRDGGAVCYLTKNGIDDSHKLSFDLLTEQTLSVTKGDKFYIHIKPVSGVCVDGDHAAPCAYFRYTKFGSIVSFDPNGGSGMLQIKTVDGDGVVSDFPLAEKTGSFFTGWYTEKTGGSRVHSVAVQAGSTVYAHYSSFFAGQGMTVGKDLSMRFYLKLTEQQAADAILRTSISGTPGVSADLKVSEKEGEYYVCTFKGITPERMTDTITAQLLIGGSAVDSLTYSVCDYCMDQYDRKAELSLQLKLAALLQYGAAAQEYAGFKTELPATVAAKGFAYEDLSKLTAPRQNKLLTVSSNPIRFTSARMWLGREVKLLCTIVPGADPTGYYLIIRYPNGTTAHRLLSSLENEEGALLLRSDALKLSDISKNLTIELRNGSGALVQTLSYGFGSYAASKWNVSGSLQTLVRALYLLSSRVGS